MAIGLATAQRNAGLDAITAAAGASAKLLFYNGVRPATGGAITTLLATLICNATFAPASAAGVLALNAITSAAAVATSTATWARITTAGGGFVLDCNVGSAGSDINMSTTAFVTGATIAITSFTITDGNP